VGIFAKAFLMTMIAFQFFVASKALAFVDDFEEEEPTRQVTSLPDQAGRRAYAGGRDEQSLEVQASLPVPSRAIDGPVAATAPTGDDGDSSHD
jgi:hypothetical protein